jgi:hypothetical protein
MIRKRIRENDAKSRELETRLAGLVAIHHHEFAQNKLASTTVEVVKAERSRAKDKLMKEGMMAELRRQKEAALDAHDYETCTLLHEQIDALEAELSDWDFLPSGQGSEELETSAAQTNSDVESVAETPAAAKKKAGRKFSIGRRAKSERTNERAGGAGDVPANPIHEGEHIICRMSKLGMDEDVACSDPILDKVEVSETENPLNPEDTDLKVPQERQGDDLPTSILKRVHEGAPMANIKEKKGEKEGKKSKRKKRTHAHSLVAAELVASEDSIRDSDITTRE